jgi:HK97 family phage portal protein
MLERLRAWFRPEAAKPAEAATRELSEALAEFLGMANVSRAGVPFVSPSIAWRLSPVYRAVTLVANDFARSPMEAEGPLEELLASNAHGRFEFLRALVAQAVTYGAGRALIFRRGGAPAELVLRTRSQITADVDEHTNTVRYEDVEYGVIPAEDVFDLRAPSLSGLVGRGGLVEGKDALALLAAMQAAGLSVFSGGGASKVALVHPAKLSDDAKEKIRENWRKNHTDPANASVPVILSEGMKPERIGSSLNDAGFDEARRFSVADVSRLTGVPLPYLSEHQDTAYANQEWLGRIYVEGCLEHWAAAFNGEAEAKLGSSIVCDFEQIKAPSFNERSAAMGLLVDRGIINRNEARARLGWRKGPAHLDQYTLPLNQGKSGGSNDGGPVAGQKTNAEAVQ